jgi:glutathione synthase/RimK-type ligase-like ATP-grasp enzyme
MPVDWAVLRVALDAAFVAGDSSVLAFLSAKVQPVPAPSRADLRASGIGKYITRLVRQTECERVAQVCRSILKQWKRAAHAEQAGLGPVPPRVALLTCSGQLKQLASATRFMAESFAQAGQPIPEEDAASIEPELVQALQAAGFAPEWAQWDDPAMGAAEWRQFQVVIVRGTWDYSTTEARRQQFLALVRQLAEHALVLNPPALLEWNSHKGYLLRLQERGVPVLPSVLLRSQGGGPALLGELDGLCAACGRGAKSGGGRGGGGSGIGGGGGGGGGGGTVAAGAAAAQASGGGSSVRGREEAAAGAADTCTGAGGLAAFMAQLERWGSVVLKPAVAGGGRGTQQFDLGLDASAAVAAVFHGVTAAADSGGLPHTGVGRPVDGANGGDTAPGERRRQVLPQRMRLLRHLRRLAAEGDVIGQRFEPAVRAGEVSVVCVAGVGATHCVLKTPAAGDFRTQCQFGGSVEGVELTPARRHAAERAFAALPPGALLARVDFLEVPVGEGGGEGEGAGGGEGAGRDDGEGEGDCALLVMEVEAIEPEVFFECCPGAADELARAVSCAYVNRTA